MSDTPEINMTPEQLSYFMRAFWNLLTADATGKLTAPEFRTGLILLWITRGPSNGYISISHAEAWAVCGTNANSTMRNHLIHLRDANVLRDYSTNGTVRVKLNFYPGREMIVHRRANSLDESANSLDESANSLDESANSLDESANSLDEPAVTEKECYSRSLSQRERSLSQLLRALSQQPSRKFDDYPQSDPSMLLLLNNNITTENTGTQQQPVLDPVEQAIAFSLLSRAGVWRNIAKPLSATYPLTEIRKAVCEYVSNPGKYRSAKIIETFLKEGAPLPEINESFRQSELYLAHRTKDEITNSQPVVADRIADDDEHTDNVDEWRSAGELWEKTLAALDLPAIVKSSWLANAVLWRNAETFFLELPKHQVEHVQTRFRPVLRRAIATQSGVTLSDLNLVIKESDEEPDR